MYCVTWGLLTFDQIVSLHIMGSLTLRIATITGNDAKFSGLKGCGLQIML